MDESNDIEKSGFELSAADPPPFFVMHRDAASPLMLVCDHASCRFPEALGDMGLDPFARRCHLAVDIGAGPLTEYLADSLGLTAVLAQYSRLVVDCNRPLGSPQSIAEQSAGATVPGNRGLSSEERAARIDGLYRPYHESIDQLLDSRCNQATMLLSIHSFTPVLNGQSRPWHVGISHWRDRRLAALLLGALSRHCDLRVGDNEPYPIELETDYTIPQHGGGRGLPSVMIEIRQDGIGTDDAASAWAERLADAYRSIEPEALRLHESWS